MVPITLLALAFFLGTLTIVASILMIVYLCNRRKRDAESRGEGERRTGNKVSLDKVHHQPRPMLHQKNAKYAQSYHRESYIPNQTTVLKVSPRADGDNKKQSNSGKVYYQVPSTTSVSKQKLIKLQHYDDDPAIHVLRTSLLKLNTYGAGEDDFGGCVSTGPGYDGGAAGVDAAGFDGVCSSGGAGGYDSGICSSGGAGGFDSGICSSSGGVSSVGGGGFDTGGCSIGGGGGFSSGCGSGFDTGGCGGGGFDGGGF